MSTSAVFLIGNAPELREDISLLFNAHGFAVSAFEDTAAFLERCRANWAGCVILDMDATGRAGLELLGRLRSQGVELPIIFLAEHADTAAIVRAIRLGAYDFMIKPVDINALFRQVANVMRLSQEQMKFSRKKDALLGRIASLTERERKILSLALSGKSNKEVSQMLGISHRTVETHRSHILVKLEIGNLLELAHAFIEMEHSLFAPDKSILAHVSE